MPAPLTDIIASSTTSLVQVALEPAFNAFNSLVMLGRAGKLSGLGEWIIKTSASMTREERQRNELVTFGYYYAAIPLQSWPSFPAYLDHLESLSPDVFRDKLMDAYSDMPCCEEYSELTVDRVMALESVDNYLEFLRQRFSTEHVDDKLESEAYAYVIDPPEMKRLITSHLRMMWDTYLEEEWQRIVPMLLDAKAAFEQVNYREMSKIETVEFITGKELQHDHWTSMIEKAEQIVFVPSAHVGPYTGKFMSGDTLGIVFRARLPEGTQYYAPDLSRAEILVLLNALADDTRLRILQVVAGEGEMRSQEIMNELELSQSATSRHLKQLSATGYLTERRCEGAKCYELNNDRVEDLVGAISSFLLDA
ncbi:MAG TPA: metalloregulator ArsR/SmtB family transcription factor [candidate division Zixibacteria bacterium]|nr:metalloregulator ArsR/SmtB family transcription factor [candidate division Zixibacteria bacterium]